MEYDYAAAVKHLNALRDKVRRSRMADGTYKDLGLSDPQTVQESARPVVAAPKTRTLGS